MDLLYIFGDPGIGKSTVVAALVGGRTYECRTAPFIHLAYDNGVVELGNDREHFRGTDALELDVQPKVLKWLQEEQPALVLAEGDRLANGRFFAACRGLGYTLWPVCLQGKDLAAQRRQRRSAELGTRLQDATWVLGRQSKNVRLAKDWDAMPIHPTLPAPILAKLLPGPVAAAFRVDHSTGA